MTSCLHFKFVRFTFVSNFSAKHFTPNDLSITIFMQHCGPLLGSDRLTSFSTLNSRAVTNTEFRETYQEYVQEIMPAS